MSPVLSPSIHQIEREIHLLSKSTIPERKTCCKASWLSLESKCSYSELHALQLQRQGGLQFSKIGARARKCNFIKLWRTCLWSHLTPELTWQQTTHDSPSGLVKLPVASLPDRGNIVRHNNEDLEEFSVTTHTVSQRWCSRSKASVQDSIFRTLSMYSWTGGSFKKVVQAFYWPTLNHRVVGWINERKRPESSNQ